MADVRSMLRAERAARRITHPHASYSGDGKLSCNLCQTLVKSEAQWQSHLHSTQHTLRSQRAKDAKATRAPDGGGASKKRKAESLDVDSPVSMEKKRVRSNVEVDTGLEAGPDEQPAAVHDAKEVVNDITELGDPTELAATTQPPSAAPTVDPEAPADEEELAAFERELAALEAESRAAASASALDTGATISAAPMTAEQLAAQASEAASTQKGKRERELEDEREDAERTMEDEFEEMEGLEERVRKLRERREALRKEREVEADVAGPDEWDEAPANAVTGSGNDENDDDDDDDEWHFGGT